MDGDEAIITQHLVRGTRFEVEVTKKKHTYIWIWAHVFLRRPC